MTFLSIALDLWCNMLQNDSKRDEFISRYWLPIRDGSRAVGDRTTLHKWVRSLVVTPRVQRAYIMITNTLIHGLVR